MGRRGDAFDNAVAEGFFAALETELLDRHTLRGPRPGSALYNNGRGATRPSAQEP
jgi:hypothetical protein